MTAAQESRLNMYRSTQKHYTDNPAIVATVPAFATTATAFNTIISAIISTAQQEDLQTKGIAIDKTEARINLCHLAADIAALIFAYASSINDNKLKQQINFTYSDLLRSKDDELAPRIQNIIDTATQNIANLKDYGITAEILTTLQTTTTDFQSKVPTPRNSVAQKKTIRENLRKLFADGDKLLKERLDKTAIGFKKDNPDFLSTYKANRVIVDPGTSTTTLKGTVKNAVDKKPVSGAGIVVSTGSKTTSNAAGSFQIKPVQAGKLTINVSAPNFKDAIVENVSLKQGQSTNVTIELQPV